MIPLNLVRFLEKNYVECFSFGPDQWARLISTEGFIGINGATPLTTIPGFTPWRPQAWNKIFKLSFAKCLAPQATYLLLLVEEILLICSLSHYLQSFIHPRWCRISAINSMKKIWPFSSSGIFPQNCLGIEGIYPDLLHILDLAIYCDNYASAFLVWTDSPNIFPGRSRDERLLVLYRRYLEWCTENRFWDL